MKKRRERWKAEKKREREADEVKLSDYHIKKSVEEPGMVGHDDNSTARQDREQTGIRTRHARNTHGITCRTQFESGNTLVK